MCSCSDLCLSGSWALPRLEPKDVELTLGEITPCIIWHLLILFFIAFFTCVLDLISLTVWESHQQKINSIQFCFLNLSQWLEWRIACLFPVLSFSLCSIISSAFLILLFSLLSSCFFLISLFLGLLIQGMNLT